MPKREVINLKMLVARRNESKADTGRFVISLQNTLNFMSFWLNFIIFFILIGTIETDSVDDTKNLNPIFKKIYGK
jgi:hypothetical protein